MGWLLGAHGVKCEEMVEKDHRDHACDIEFSRTIGISRVV